MTRPKPSDEHLLKSFAAIPLVTLSQLAALRRARPPDVDAGVVRARSIQIVNNAGEPVLILRAGDDGNGQVVVSGADGTVAALLDVTASGGRLLVSNSEGQLAALMNATPEGDGLLATVDAAGHVVMLGRISDEE